MKNVNRYRVKKKERMSWEKRKQKPRLFFLTNVEMTLRNGCATRGGIGSIVSPWPPSDVSFDFVQKRSLPSLLYDVSIAAGPCATNEPDWAKLIPHENRKWYPKQGKVRSGTRLFPLIASRILMSQLKLFCRNLQTDYDLRHHKSVLTATIAGWTDVERIKQETLFV